MDKYDIKIYKYGNSMMGNTIKQYPKDGEELKNTVSFFFFA